MAVYTADDMIALLQQMPFVVGSGVAVIKDSACASAFVAAAVNTRNILSVMKQREVTSDDLAYLSGEISVIGKHFVDMQYKLSDKDKVNTAIPKVHAICHFPYL